MTLLPLDILDPFTKDIQTMQKVCFGNGILSKLPGMFDMMKNIALCAIS
jgi:hypothetical protein